MENISTLQLSALKLIRTVREREREGGREGGREEGRKGEREREHACTCTCTFSVSHTQFLIPDLSFRYSHVTRSTGISYWKIYLLH